MATPYLAEIRIFSFAYAPRHWALCNGQILAISTNTALFSLLGTTYGGNGVTTFALPNLQGRAPMHFNGSHPLGQAAGAAAHTLLTSEIPAHTHTAQGSTDTATARTAVGGVWASGTALPYSTAAADLTLNAAALANSGGNQPHPNEQPYLVLNFSIALSGVYPSRS